MNLSPGRGLPGEPAVDSGVRVRSQPNWERNSPDKRSTTQATLRIVHLALGNTCRADCTRTPSPVAFLLDVHSSGRSDHEALHRSPDFFGVVCAIILLIFVRTAGQP